MMNFKNKKPVQEVAGFVNQFINHGINKLKVNNIELKESSTGKFQVKFKVEGPEITGDFQGLKLDDDTLAKGLVGTVSLGIYFATDDAFKVEGLIRNLMAIAGKMEVLDQVEAIEVDETASKDEQLKSMIAQYSKVVKGKYAWFIIKGEEYEQEKDGRVRKGVALAFKEGKIGQDDQNRKIFQIFCKHADFVKSTEKQENIVFKAKGSNIVGTSIGKSDVLEFNPQYDYQPLIVVASDDEDDDMSGDIEDF